MHLLIKFKLAGAEVEGIATAERTTPNGAKFYIVKYAECKTFQDFTTGKQTTERCAAQRWIPIAHCTVV